MVDIYKLKFTLLESKILSFLMIRAGEEFTQRDVAKAVSVSPTAVMKSLPKLSEKQFVAVRKLKSMNLVSLNRDLPIIIHLKRVENLRLIYLSGLRDYLFEQFPGCCVILFGSYAKGEDICSSDVDIAIIGANKKDLVLTDFENVLLRPINVNIYSSWIDISGFLRNNILNGIVLSGSIDLDYGD